MSEGGDRLISRECKVRKLTPSSSPSGKNKSVSATS